MKTTLAFVVLMTALSVRVFAEDAPVSAGTNSPSPIADASLQKKLPPRADSPDLNLSLRPPAKPTTRMAGVDFTAEGAVVNAARAGQIWQAVNPLAPAEFGRTYDNPAWEPPGRPPGGIVLFSFRFGQASRHRR